jgi:hypothetical protein
LTVSLSLHQAQESGQTECAGCHEDWNQDGFRAHGLGRWVKRVPQRLETTRARRRGPELAPAGIGPAICVRIQAR